MDDSLIKGKRTTPKSDEFYRRITSKFVDYLQVCYGEWEL